MVRTVRDALVTALESLDSKGLKKFRNKLNDWEIKDGYNKIPRGQLEAKEPEDIADLIRKYYTDSYGIEVTLAVLDAIDEKKVAEDLQADPGNVDDGSRQQHTGTHKARTSKDYEPQQKIRRIEENFNAMVSPIFVENPTVIFHSVGTSSIPFHSSGNKVPIKCKPAAAQAPVNKPTPKNKKKSAAAKAPGNKPTPKKKQKPPTVKAPGKKTTPKKKQKAAKAKGKKKQKPLTAKGEKKGANYLFIF
ncbi:uncharacterized protein LOC142098436 [Mixophyes fleayi]|uniref:uncharacterized protein LOC142098436 n=1 Tax=Mixophyes fleayi TaxID=3061075 RepID=UPI003F4DD44C